MSKKSSFVKAVKAMSKNILREVEEGSKKSVIIIADLLLPSLTSLRMFSDIASTAFTKLLFLLILLF